VEPIIHLHQEPERFVAGTIGPPGQRTFYLQAKSTQQLTSVRLEKEQVQVLAEKINELLDDPLESQMSDFGTTLGLSAVEVDDNQLEMPVVEDFTAGNMTLSWDAMESRVVIEVFGISDDPAEIMMVKLSTDQARAFARHSQMVVSGGRPTCVFCGHPIDPDGHLCVRANGFRRRST
jgi:uncharacterized repeat protein (TIGR03847 family)